MSSHLSPLRRVTAEASRSEGQSATLAILFLFLFAAFGAVVIDVGLLMNERRDVQSDADRAALAGTMELSLSFDPGVGAADEASAIGHAVSWAGKNGVPSDAGLTVTPVRDCFSGAGGDDGTATGIQVTVERETPSFFIGALGITDWTATATSVACSAGRDIAIVIDRSGSMCHDSTAFNGTYCPPPPPEWQPFTAVQDAAIAFAENFSPVWDQLALVSYSTEATTDQPLGDDFGPGGALDDAIEDMWPGGYTNIGDAIAHARAELTGPSAHPTAAKILVLLTDGIPNRPGGTSAGTAYAQDQASLAAADGIRIYVIGLGDEVDGDFLQGIASTGQGTYLNAPTGAALQAAFQTIADLAHARLVQ